MAESFLSEIRLFSFNFPPSGWATCDGQTLSIVQNQALFALIGTLYGGNGTTTFNLPDLRGCVPLHFNAGYPQSSRGGLPSVQLAANQMPTHAHVPQGNSNSGNATTPVSNVWAAQAANPYAGSANAQLGSTAIASTGGSGAHTNMQPSLVLNFCIALTGVWPSRD